MDYKIKDSFICNYCRNICGGCNEDLERLHNGIVDEKNKDLVGRKHEIQCLGKWCDNPCELQDMDAIPDTEALINCIKFLGGKVNSLIEEHRVKSQIEEILMEFIRHGGIVSDVTYNGKNLEYCLDGFGKSGNGILTIDDNGEIVLKTRYGRVDAINSFDDIVLVSLQWTEGDERYQTDAFAKGE